MESKYKLVTMEEMSQVFDEAGVSNILTLPRTADVMESIINVVDSSLDESSYDFHSLIDTEDGLAFILKLKSE